MKEAEKIINQCEAWSKADQKNRAAAVIMADNTQKEVYMHFAGTSRDMGHLVNSLMNEDKEFGHDIYAAACVYAHKHIEVKERDKINDVANEDAMLEFVVIGRQYDVFRLAFNGRIKG